jgi:Outer membrane protein beta-barrel domain
MHIKGIMLCAALAAPLSLHAQRSGDTLSLDGRKAITFGLGLTGARNTTTVGGTTATHTDGQVGSISYNQYIRSQLGIEVEAAVLNADSFVQPGRTHNNSITPLLFGITLAPEVFALTRHLRPFFAAGVGPYIHTVNDVSSTGVSTSTETVAGARFGFGLDWRPARHFLMNVEAKYHAVGDFDHPDAATEKVSGWGASLGLGFVWGGR